MPSGYSTTHPNGRPPGCGAHYGQGPRPHPRVHHEVPPHEGGDAGREPPPPGGGALPPASPPHRPPTPTLCESLTPTGWLDCPSRYLSGVEKASHGPNCSEQWSFNATSAGAQPTSTFFPFICSQPSRAADLRLAQVIDLRFFRHKMQKGFEKGAKISMLFWKNFPVQQEIRVFCVPKMAGWPENVLAVRKSGPPFAEEVGAAGWAPVFFPPKNMPKL